MNNEFNDISKESGSFKIPTIIILESVKNLNELLVSESVFKIDSQGLSIYSLDPTNISLIDIQIRKEEFIKFNFIQEIRFNINIKSFLEILKNQKKSILEFNLNQEFNKLNLFFDSGLNSVITLLTLEDIKENPIYKLDFTHTIKIKDIKGFKDQIKSLSDISESSFFNIESGSFKIESRGGLSYGAYIVSSEIVKNIYDSPDFKTLFALEYLLKFVKNGAYFNSLEISIRDQAPILFIYRKGNFTIKYILAPRIEGED